MALLSPGVEIKEIDASTIVPTVSDSTGVFCGEFDQGPIMHRVLITNPDDLIGIFGKPTDQNYNQFFQVWNFLQYANTIYVTRVQNKEEAISASWGVSEAVTINNAPDFELKEPLLLLDEALGVIAQSPGTHGNDIEVEIVLPQDFKAPEKRVVFGGIQVESFFEYAPDQENSEFGLIIRKGDELEAFTVSSNKDAKDGNSKNIFVENVLNRQSGLVYVKQGDLANIQSTAQDSMETEQVTPSVIELQFNDSGLTYLSQEGPNQEEGVITGPVKGKMKVTFSEILQDGSVVTVTQEDSQGELSTFDLVVQYDKKATPIKPQEIQNNSIKLSGGALGTGTPQLGEAYELYDNVEELDVDIIIGNEEDDGNSQIDLQAKRKDCIQFYGSPYEVSTHKKATEAVQSIEDWRNNSLGWNSMFACVQGNYKYQYDRYNDKNRWLNLQGDIQGLRAQTNTSNQAWWASQGLDRGQIKNVLKLQFIPNQPSRDLLYKASINPVTTFPGLGTVMWGQEDSLQA